MLLGGLGCCPLKGGDSVVVYSLIVAAPIVCVCGFVSGSCFVAWFLVSAVV